MLSDWGCPVVCCGDMPGSSVCLGAWVSNAAHSMILHELLSKLRPDLEAMGCVLLHRGSLFPRFDYFSTFGFSVLLKMTQASMTEGCGKEPTA